MPYNFPNAPNPGEIFNPPGGPVFTWDGTVWATGATPAGPEGPAGPAGATGPTGPTGPSAPGFLRWACSDETTPISLGNAKVTDRMPYAFTATGIRASLNTAQASGAILTVDLKWWNGSSFVTALSTLLTFDNTEATSKTAAAQPVLSKTSFADDDIIRIDVTQVGDGTATGLKVTLLGMKTSETIPPDFTETDEVIGGIVTISSTAPSSPATGDVWIDTT